jgi:hypothetical protein
MTALAAIAVLGIIIFAFDVISNLFSSKPVERQKQVPAPPRSFVSFSTEESPKEYTFQSLPYRFQNNYKFLAIRKDRSRYQYYSPRPSAIVSGQPTPWVPLMPRYESRLHSPDLIAQITDLELFRTASAYSLIDQLSDDIVCAEAAIGHYPAAYPKAAGTITPPEQPEILSLNDLLSESEVDALSEDEADVIRGFLDLTNEKRSASYAGALKQLKRAQQETEKRLQEAKQHWEEASRTWDAAVKADLDLLRSLRERVESEFGVEEIAKLVISSAALPRWMPTDFELSFDHDSGILILEHRLPHFDDIKWLKKVVLKQSTPFKPITISERKKVRSEYEPLLALSLATILARQFEHADVEMVAVNGWVEFRSKSTGKTQRAFCVSMAAPADRLRELDLNFADPLVAFSSLKGATTPSLELAPVAPKIRLNFNDKRFVESRDILHGLNQDENLAAMDWEDFEHLCRELFEKVFATEGATVSVTQASRDQGVDAVILDPDPIRGGKIVIQAKRYVNTVDVSAVRDLWGVVSHEGAMKGLLVTTSQFGPDAYAFAQGKPLTLINGSELLHLLERNGYKFRINLEEARRILKDAGIPAPKRRSRPSG